MDKQRERKIKKLRSHYIERKKKVGRGEHRESLRKKDGLMG